MNYDEAYRKAIRNGVITGLVVLAAIIGGLYLLIGSAEAEPKEEHQELVRARVAPIRAYHMKDGVRCYLYAAESLSCIQVKP